MMSQLMTTEDALNYCGGKEVISPSRSSDVWCTKLAMELLVLIVVTKQRRSVDQSLSKKLGKGSKFSPIKFHLNNKYNNTV